MTKQRTMILGAAVTALFSGLAGGVSFAAEESPTTGDEDSSTAGESAKMGKEEGTHIGPGQGVTPEVETGKIVQPPRTSPYTTGGETPTEQPTPAEPEQ